MISKFTLKSIFPVASIFSLLAGLVVYTYFAFDTTKKPPPLHGIPLILLLTFTFLWFFFGEFRTKMIKITLDDKFVIVKYFGGFMTDKKYLYDELDGFKISILRSSASDNEYLYLFKDGKRFVKYQTFIIKIITA